MQGLIRYTKENTQIIEDVLGDDDHEIEKVDGNIDYYIKSKGDHSRLSQGDYLLITDNEKFVIPNEVYRSFYGL